MNYELDLQTAHYERGRFVSSANQVEGLLDVCLSAFYGFGPADPHFRGWLLHRLNFNAKIEIFELVLKDHAWDESSKTLVRELHDLRVERNRVAHSTIAPRITGLEDLADLATKMTTQDLSAAMRQVNFAGVSATRSTRDGLTEMEEDISDLKAWNARIEATWFRLAGVVTKAPFATAADGCVPDSLAE